MRITSWHGPFDTVLGKNDSISASFGSILSLPIKPSGMRISRYSEMRWATVSTESTCRPFAVNMRDCRVAKDRAIMPRGGLRRDA